MISKGCFVVTGMGGGVDCGGGGVVADNPFVAEADAGVSDIVTGLVV